jgi:hypothetical protein
VEQTICGEKLKPGQLADVLNGGTPFHCPQELDKHTPFLYFSIPQDPHINSNNDKKKH